MVKIEAQPVGGDIIGRDWKHRRNSIQIELMKRMGVSADLTQNDIQKEKQRDTVGAWIGSYAKKFAEVVDQDTGLQDRLMSDDENVRYSALEEVVHILQEEDKNDLS